MSLKLTRTLAQEGFDNATAETIVRLADEKPPEEASQLLAGMLGENSPHIAEYVKARQAAKQKEIDQLNRFATADLAPAIERQRQQQQQKKSDKVFSVKEKTDYIKDLEAAVQRLSVNAPDRPKCDCLGSKHGLLDVAPNCLHCGRIVCNKEGLGPCLFCGHALLPDEQVRDVLTILTEQRNSVAATMSKRALAAAGIDPATKPDSKAISSSAEEAQKNLERLLSYQDNDTVRTRIIDQVGDVDVPALGMNMWATPAEQAEQLKIQQRRLRRLEEERKARVGRGRKVMSIDIRGNKVYQTVEDASYSSEEDDDEPEMLQQAQDPNRNADDRSISQRDSKQIAYYDPSNVKSHRPPQLDDGAGLNTSAGKDPKDTTGLNIVYDSEQALLY